MHDVDIPSRCSPRPIGVHLEPRVLSCERAQIRKRRGRLNLSSNELGHPGAEALASEFLADIDPVAVVRYPDLAGAVASAAEHSGLPEDCVLLTAGSDDAIRLIVGLLGRTGRMILQSPNYDNYRRYGSVFGLSQHPVFHSPHAVDAFPARFQRALRDHPPSLVVIANPHGFSGWCYPIEQISEWADLSRAHGHLLVVDEAYTAFADIDHTELVVRGSHVVLVRSFSKGLGMAGLRLAMVAGPPSVIDYLERWQPANAISALALACFRHHLANWGTVAKVRADIISARAWLERRVPFFLPGSTAFPSSANFVLMDTGSTLDSAALLMRFADRKIRVRDLTGVAGYETCLRLTVHHRPVMERALASVALD